MYLAADWAQLRTGLTRICALGDVAPTRTASGPTVRRTGPGAVPVQACRPTQSDAAVRQALGSSPSLRLSTRRYKGPSASRASILQALIPEDNRRVRVWRHFLTNFWSVVP